MFALEIDQERGLENQRLAHLSTGGLSLRRSSSTRSSAASGRTGPFARYRARSSRDEMVSSGHEARRTTSLKDSVGYRRAVRKRSYASRLREIVLIPIHAMCTLHG